MQDPPAEQASAQGALDVQDDETDEILTRCKLGDTIQVRGSYPLHATGENDRSTHQLAGAITVKQDP